MRALIWTARLREAGRQLRCLRTNSVLRDITLKIELLSQEQILTSMLCLALGMQDGLGPDLVALMSTFYAFSSPACDNQDGENGGFWMEYTVFTQCVGIALADLERR